MSTREKIVIEISTQKGDFHASDFSYFMYLFRVVYVAALDEIPNQTRLKFSEIDMEKIEPIISILERKFKNQFTQSDIRRLASRKLPPEDDLDISDIHRRNPVDITFVAIPLAISVVAVIIAGAWTLSGGTIKVPDLVTAIKIFGKKLGLFVRSP